MLIVTSESVVVSTRALAEYEDLDGSFQNPPGNHTTLGLQVPMITAMVIPPPFCITTVQDQLRFFHCEHIPSKEPSI